jgi:aldehyde:ferredoxin oxidoreductase
MINRKGIGDILADGTKVASRKIGKGAEKYAVHAGGQNLPCMMVGWTRALQLLIRWSRHPGGTL